jgi:membrane-associated protease RseP (regulator of RpoE activity)
MKDNRLVVEGVASSPVWSRLIEQSNVVVGFDIRLQDDPNLPTDAAVFYGAGVPAVSLTTGPRLDHHRPTDVPSSLNYGDLERVAAFAALFASRLDRLEVKPPLARAERKAGASSSHDTLEAYTGTVPDYTAQVEGLRLGGVIEGGPAEQAGLAEGDVIVEFAGQEVGDIYDYMGALESVRPDQPVKVVFVRDGERHEVSVTPTTRP